MKGTEFIFYMRIEMLIGVATSATQIEEETKITHGTDFPKLENVLMEQTVCVRQITTIVIGKI